MRVYFNFLYIRVLIYVYDNFYLPMEYNMITTVFLESSLYYIYLNFLYSYKHILYYTCIYILNVLLLINLNKNLCTCD